MTSGSEPGRDRVALVMALGLALSLVIIVAAVFYDAVRSDTPGLSENATQVLTGAFGGIVGALAAYLGFRVGSARTDEALYGRQSDETPSGGMTTAGDSPGAAQRPGASSPDG